MEKYHLSISLRDLIAKLLNNGLESHYDEVIKFIDENKNYKEMYFLFYTLEHLKQNSIVLDLKIQEYKLHQINEFLNIPSFLLPKEDGFIHIDAEEEVIKDYYELDSSMLPYIKIDNFTYPAFGQTKIFYETTYDNSKGYHTPVIREMEVDHMGRVINIKTNRMSSAPNNCVKPTEIPNIYQGILGDILSNLTTNNP